MDVNSIVTKQDLKEFMEKISIPLEAVQQLVCRHTKNQDEFRKYVGYENKYLRSREARKLLNVSDNKLRDMRNSREIPFTLIGKTYYYPEAAILQLLENNMRKPNA